MLLTENIVFRLREWLDRETEEPDLVPRLRRLWTEPTVHHAGIQATRCGSIDLGEEGPARAPGHLIEGAQLAAR